MVVAALASDLAKLHTKLLVLVNNVIDVFFSQNEQMYLTVRHCSTIPSSRLFLVEDVAVTKVGALHVDNEGEVGWVGLAVVVHVDVHIELHLALLDEVDFIRLLSLGVEDVLRQEFERAEDRQYGPQKVGVFAPEEVDFLNDLAVGVLDDLGPERAGELMEELFLMVNTLGELAVAFEVLADLLVEVLVHASALFELLKGV